MNKIDREFGFGRHVNYIKINFYVQWKSLVEYKINFYFAIIMNTLYSLTMVLFYFIISIEFNDLLGWGFKEYFFLTTFSGFIATFFGMFYFNMNLKRYILQGSLNSYMTRPISSFVQYFITSSSIFIGFSSIMYILLLVYFFIYIYTDFSWIKLIVVFLFGSLAGVFTFLLTRVIDSVGFYFKDNNFLLQPFLNGSGMFNRFPVVMFKNYFVIIGYIFGNVYYGAYATQYFFGYIDFSELLRLIGILSVLIFVCVICIYLLWKFGLEKYEAYG